MMGAIGLDTLALFAEAWFSGALGRHAVLHPLPLSRHRLHALLAQSRAMVVLVVRGQSLVVALSAARATLVIERRAGRGEDGDGVADVGQRIEEDAEGCAEVGAGAIAADEGDVGLDPDGPGGQAVDEDEREEGKGGAAAALQAAGERLGAAVEGRRGRGRGAVGGSQGGHVGKGGRCCHEHDHEFDYCTVYTRATTKAIVVLRQASTVQTDRNGWSGVSGVDGREEMRCVSRKRSNQYQ